MKIDVTTNIEAPVEKVFDLFTDLSSIEAKVPGIISIEVLEGPHKMQVGTKWRETREFMGKEATETMVITELTPNKSYTAEAASHGMEYTSTYHFEETAKTTSVTLNFTGKPITLAAKLMTPIAFLFQSATTKAFEKDMLELKAAVENN